MIKIENVAKVLPIIIVKNPPEIDLAPAPADAPTVIVTIQNKMR